PDDGEMRLRFCGLLLETDDLPFCIDLGNPVALGVLHIVAEDRRAVRLLRRAPDSIPQSHAVEDVVAQDQGDAIRPDKIPADDEGLREAIGRRLFGVLKAHAPLLAVTE